MNRVVLLLAVLCTPFLAGCATFGYPPDAVRPGQTASLLVALAGDECLVGPPFGTLPSRLAQAAAGHREGESFDLPLKTSLACNEVIVRGGVVDRSTRDVPLTRRNFDARALSPATPGQNVTLRTDVGPETVLLVSLNATHAVIRPPLPPPRQARPDLGLDVLAWEEDGLRVTAVAANVTGAVVPGPFRALGLPAGNFTVVGMSGSDVKYASDGWTTVGPGLARVTVLRVLPVTLDEPSGHGARSPAVRPAHG